MPVFDSTTVMDLEKTLPLHTGDVYGLAVSEDVVATTSGDRVYNYNLLLRLVSHHSVENYGIIIIFYKCNSFL